MGSFARLGAPQDDGGRYGRSLAHLASESAAWRKEAALVLGDWLYPRAGLSEAEVQIIHQALLTAAIAETDEDACYAELNALTRSNRAIVRLKDWDRLLERLPDYPSGPQTLALMLLSVFGEPAFADRLKTLATEYSYLDHARTHKTISELRGDRAALSGPQDGAHRQDGEDTGLSGVTTDRVRPAGLDRPEEDQPQ